MAKAQTPAQAKAQAAAKKALEVATVVVAAAGIVATAAIDLQALTHIVTATTSDVGYSYTPASVSAPLEAAGYVEVRTDVTDQAGNQATRATQAGIDYVASKASPFGATVEAPTVAAKTRTRTVAKAPEGGFKIVTGIPIPLVSRSFGPKASVYPFDALEVNASFFVPATEDRPNPTKTLASTVNSASLRYAIEKVVDGETVLEKTRVFVIRRIEDGAPWGFDNVAGAAVFRTT